MFNKPWFRIALIISLGFIVYSFALSSPFKFLDDQVTILENPLVQQPGHYQEIFTQGYFHDHSYYRPLIILSYKAETFLFGIDAFFFNLDNCILHILNALLVWILVRLLTGSPTWGFWVGLLFVIHPIHVEAVSNISGRGILLSATGVLSSFIMFLLYDQRKKVGFLVASIVFFILGLLCKESSAVLPGVIFFYLWLNKKPLWRVGPFAVVILLYLSWRHHLGMTQMFPYRSIYEHSLGVVTFLNSLFVHLRLLILPTDLYFDRSQEVFLSFKDVLFMGTVLIWGTVLSLLLVYRKRIPMILLFAIGWFFLEMFPVAQVFSSIIVASRSISTADHFLYLASIPFFILFVYGLENLWKLNQQKKWLSSMVLGVVAMAYLANLLIITIEQNIYSGHEVKTIQESLRRQPQNARLLFAMGIIYTRNRQFKEAEPYFLKAMAANPQDVRYPISLGQCLCDQGRYQEGLNIFNAIENPGNYQDIIDTDRKNALLHLMSKPHA
ncbi:MAG: glycosyltransferase family 39 protein [Candidatus Omnitrophica bacterium]|nr:glycosyltransferase family 39 protein [Candidatus Omnitrophota bacterium]